MTRWGAVTIVLALLLATLTVSASTSSEDPITACLGKSGNLRVVADETECRSKEQPLSWNHEGPQGPAGPPGPPGPPGPAGADGVASLQGAPCRFDGADGESLAVTDATGQITFFCIVTGINDPTAWYRDRDQDGHGSGTEEVLSPQPVRGYVSTGDDCDDTDPAIHPGAADPLNGLDDDCDGLIDEDPADPWYLDSDGDGHGDPTQVEYGSTRPSGFVANGDDCDDTSSDVYPGATEAPDGIDNDCDGQVDEGACPAGYTAVDGRCVDLSSDPENCGEPGNAAGPNEHCSGGMLQCNDGYDRASDGTCQPILTWYADADGDSYGDPLRPAEAAEPPPGYTDNAGDCDDTRADVHPGAAEIDGDGIDNDCDGVTDAS